MDKQDYTDTLLEAIHLILDFLEEDGENFVKRHTLEPLLARLLEWVEGPNW